MNPKPEVGDRYVLETGEAGAARLRLLHQVYGPATEALLTELGVGPGWRAVDFGCGIGSTTLWLARRVSLGGSVVGVDVSPDQLAVARQAAESAGLANVSFVEASAYETGLPGNSFDLACCRVLLNHLQHPGVALQEMRRLLKPGGLLVCEEADLRTLATDPPSAAYQEFVELSLKVAEGRGVNFRLGLSLHRLFRALRLDPEVRFTQPTPQRDERRRLWEYTFLEALPALAASGLVPEDRLRSLAGDLTRDTLDPTRLVAPPMLVQVWARKP